MNNGDRIRQMTNEELVAVIPCPYIKDVYDECKFGWRERTQTCEECKLEYLNKKTEPKNIKEAVLDELF